MEIHSFFFEPIRLHPWRIFLRKFFLTSERKFEKIISSAHREVAARFKFSISRFESDCRLIIGAQIVVGIYTLSCRNHLKFWWWLCFHHHKRTNWYMRIYYINCTNFSWNSIDVFMIFDHDWRMSSWSLKCVFFIMSTSSKTFVLKSDEK